MSTIVKAGPNTATYPTPDDTDGVKAWLQGAAAARALLETNNAYQNYVHGPFSSWAASYDAGRAEEPPPGVPTGFDALMADDGFSFTLVPSGVSSGPVPAYNKRAVTASSGSIKSGVPAFGGLMFGAVGAVVSQIDGTKWQRVA